MSDTDPPHKKRRKLAATRAARHAQLESNLDRMTLLAHQLKAPLSVISALAQGLSRRGHHMSADEIRDRGRKIWHASRRLDELIGTIMNYTRANAGGIVMDRTIFDIKPVLQRIVREHERLSGLRRCELDIAALPDRISGDAVLIEQALGVVLANALRYSAENSRVIVTGHSCERSITITIRDSGIGISSHDLPFVSQPFFRGTNTRRLPGTGLGLSLARHIVSLHNGGLQIESEEGAGTTVRIELPWQGD